jgi:DNA-binding GntR family transcriptional regulator
VAQLVREALASGQFKPGERVKEAPLATRLGVSRGPVREALRVLAEEGMLELLPKRRAAVPDVTATNILDLYAVRAYLGGLLMRRIATLPSSALRPVSTTLAEVRVVAGHGDHARIGEADLRFQDAIARTAQLPQAGLIFERLTMRLRMFNAILQLDWAEAVDLIAREDIGIYEAIRYADGNEAARRWRVKVERSVRYMVAQVPQDHFDPSLWSPSPANRTHVRATRATSTPPPVLPTTPPRKPPEQRLNRPRRVFDKVVHKRRLPSQRSTLQDTAVWLRAAYVEAKRTGENTPSRG